MQTFDRIMILGALGKTPELRYLPSGDALLNLSLAASNSWKPKDSDEWKTITRWYKVSVFGKQAEKLNETLAKGDCLYVEGRLQCDENGCPRIWIGKDDGKPHSSFEVKADIVRVTAKKSNGDKPAEHAEVPAAKQEEGEDY